MYDVVVSGGSVAGLLCAREVSHSGHSVLVIEEDFEIGTPEHCGGLVSLSALSDLGIAPQRKTFDHFIERAEIFSPNGQSFTINSKKQKVAEISRRELDKQIAKQAQKNGAEIRVRTSFKETVDEGVKTSDGIIKCKIVVDARGVSSLIQKDRTGILSSAQYEVYADWIEKDKVAVYLDQLKYPSFFAWIIPSNQGAGKVGVAGRGINAMEQLEKFILKLGKHSTIRKIFAPIWINGPLEQFVTKNFVTIGDAAGQSKPTTAGGIYSCGMGGIFAGKSIAKFLESGNLSDLKNYQINWNKKFGKEFEKQLIVRKIFERLDNKTIDKLFESITPDIIQEISQSDDFDFHTSTVIKLLGLKGSLKATQAIVGNEIKNLLNR